MGQHNLVVLESHVVAGSSLLHRSLHEESTHETLADVDVVEWVCGRVRLCAAALLLQDSLELVLDVVGLLESPIVDEVVPAPVRVHSVLHKLIVCLEHSQVVSIVVKELPACVVSLVLGLSRSHKDIWHV